MGLNQPDQKKIPNHVAVVMDGNGRWARNQGLSRTEGHRAGEEALYDVVEGAIEIGIKWLTVYAFSTENWKRPLDEVKFLVSYPQQVILRRLDQFDKLGVRIRVAGRSDRRIPKGVVKDVESAVEKTKKNKNLNLVLAYNYGGRIELIDAVRLLIDEKVDSSSVTEKTIQKHLYIPEMPEPDLVIRTSGEKRTSNFLLWQSAYSEYVFSDVLWPDYRRQDLFEAVSEYQQRNRRFGGVDNS